jgi:uncharacterized protein with NAD-binding domain and iron-sulfur cluster
VAGGRTRIAILGGGVGAMTAAYELTEVPGWQDRYEITVYQMGWRIGGKGASGRNQSRSNRIEEHGLHLWFGYYENAFHLMQRAYRALGRRPNEPLATWRDAFEKHSLFVIGEFHDGAWTRWPITAPEMPGEPGDGKVPPLWEVLDGLLGFVHRHFDVHAPAELVAALEAIHHTTLPARLVACAERALGGVPAWLQPLAAARDALAALGHTFEPVHGETIIQCVEAFRSALHGATEGWLGRWWHRELAAHPDLRRLLSVLELCCITVKGLIVDDVVNRGFDALDEQDYREWLADHGASPLALDADVLRVAYETIFAYETGSMYRPNLAAGTAIRGLLRLCCTYKGAIAWKMMAGMGDTVFTPLYLVLRRRGVRFEFFQRVRNLGLDAGRHGIETIDIGVQATLRNDAEYDPLFDVNGLPCWPSEPFYEKLVQGTELRERGVDLENYWADWPDIAERRLVRGRDFDVVVLGISIGAFPLVCRELIDASPAWGTMVDTVKVVKTQAFQLWLAPSLADLGWSVGKGAPVVPPVVGGFAQPQNTYADMSHLIVRECWPRDATPGSIAYFCGPLAGHQELPGDPEQPSDHRRGFPADQWLRAEVRSRQWVHSNAATLWPHTVGPGYPHGFTDVFDPRFLVAPDAKPDDPKGRLAAQYWRVNVQPTEQYVLSLAKSTRHRLPPGRSGFRNLYLAGDWTWNVLNYGCVEAAVISGMLAARAITGHPRVIFGENFPKA